MENREGGPGSVSTWYCSVLPKSLAFFPPKPHTRHSHGPAAARAGRSARARAAGGRAGRAGQARALAVGLQVAAGGRGRGALLVPQTVTTPVETMADEAPSDEAPAAVTGENVPAACVRKPTMESQLADAVPTMTEAPVADVDQDADATVEAAMSDDVVSDSAHGVKVSPVRRRSMQLPGPLALKFKGDASSPSLSATESEDDEDELVLTRSFASLQSATSPTRAAFVPPAPISAARKVRPRSSSSSSGFSVANRKRLLGSPMHHPQNPHPHPHSSTAARPHPNSMTPVRNRRSATIATHHPSSSTSASSANMTPHNVKRNVFARRSAASERELMQEKMAADGYWIGDFRLERQLVPRRSFLSNAANNNGNNGDRSGNNSARSSPRAV